MTDNVKPFSQPDKPTPQRPEMNLTPFQHKDPNAIIARLERDRTVLEDKLTDARTVIVALDAYIRELEAYCGIEPTEVPATEPPVAG